MTISILPSVKRLYRGRRYVVLLALLLVFTATSSNLAAELSASGATEQPIDIGDTGDQEHHQHVTYACPMHPEEVSDKPGRCSQCGMFLAKQSLEDNDTEDHAESMQSMTHPHDHQKIVYACPMHPAEASDKPGRCSQCGMFLVKQTSADVITEDHTESMQGATHPHDQPKTVYSCPMHPEETSDKPGRCSQCGMFLVAQEDGEHEEHASGSHTSSHENKMPSDAMPKLGMPHEKMLMPAKAKPALFWENTQQQTPESDHAHPTAGRNAQPIPKRMLVEPEQTPTTQREAMLHDPKQHTKKPPGPTYVCPMHPQIVSHDPDSSCPICGMDLVEKSLGSAAEPSHTHGTTYICPMHPQIVSDESGSCPICGMDLVSREATAPASDHPQVFLSGAVIQNMGVRTSKVRRGTLGKIVKTQGRITADDDRIRNIHPRSGGWIETLYLLTEGDRVERKHVLADFYSPWINQAQLDFITALEDYDQVSFDPSRKTELAAKVDSLRNSLRLLSVPPMDIMRIENSRKVSNTIQLMTPTGGLVTELNVSEGAYVEPYQKMFTIVDLSEVWVMVDIYEHLAPWVRQGHRVEITAPAIPGRAWYGTVDFIYPEVDPKTRTLRARIEVSNPDEALLLNMFVQVDLSSSATKQDVLTVPREAVIVTGEREVVVKSQGNGHFQPVEVRSGIWSDNQAEILSGLEEGDEIVVSGQFLIDSESSLQASFLRMME